MWFDWCSFLLGGLLLWMLGWLLEWLLRGQRYWGLQTELQGAQNEMGRIQADLTTAMGFKGKLNSAEMEIQGLKSSLVELEQLKAQRASHDKDIEGHLAKIASLEASASGSRLELDALKGKYSTLEGERAKINADLEACRSKSSQLEGDYNSLKAELDRLKASNSDSSGEFEALKKRNADLEASQQKLQGEHGLHLQQHEALKTSFALLQGQHNDLELQLTEARKPILPDNLLIIEGIGPKMQDALYKSGIFTFKQLEAASETELRTAIERAEMPFAPSLPTWSRQAGFLVRGDTAGFQALLKELVAGRDETKKKDEGGQA